MYSRAFRVEKPVKGPIPPMNRGCARARAKEILLGALPRKAFPLRDARLEGLAFGPGSPRVPTPLASKQASKILLDFPRCTDLKLKLREVVWNIWQTCYLVGLLGWPNEARHRCC